MYLDNFPSSLDEYFEILSTIYGDHFFILGKDDPWFFTLGMRLLNQLHTDQAVKRFSKFRWQDLRRLYGLQLARSQRAMREDRQMSHFDLVCGKNSFTRGFGQLPCSLKSIQHRVSLIQEVTSKNDPILIIGDDDALSIALTQAGYTDVTVFEIDPRVIRSLEHASKKFPHSPRYHLQDVFNPVPKEFLRPYALLTFDPWYDLEGFSAFTKCGLSTSTTQPLIALSFNCGSLQLEFSKLSQLLEDLNYCIEKWAPLANTYPAPRSLRYTIGTGEIIATLLTMKSLYTCPKPEKFYFSSDLLLLRHSKV
jgi:hypothetical protein